MLPEYGKSADQHRKYLEALYCIQGWSLYYCIVEAMFVEFMLEEC